MSDLAVWVSFFGPPLFVVIITLYLFWPSNRRDYSEAKQIIFTDDEIDKRSHEVSRPADKMKA